MAFGAAKEQQAPLERVYALAARTGHARGMRVRVVFPPVADKCASAALAARWSPAASLARPTRRGLVRLLQRAYERVGVLPQAARAFEYRRG
jgi:hypothetical protein